MEKINIKYSPIPYGFMVWWKNVDKAALYHVNLYIGNDIVVPNVSNTDFGVPINRINGSVNKLCSIAVDRNNHYYSFNNLGFVHLNKTYEYINSTITGNYIYNREYIVDVEAEDRSGNIIATSDKIMCNIIQLRETY